MFERLSAGARPGRPLDAESRLAKKREMAAESEPSFRSWEKAATLISEAGRLASHNDEHSLHSAEERYSEAISLLCRERPQAYLELLLTALAGRERCRNPEAEQAIPTSGLSAVLAYAHTSFEYGDPASAKDLAQVVLSELDKRQSRLEAEESEYLALATRIYCDSRSFEIPTLTGQALHDLAQELCGRIEAALAALRTLRAKDEREPLPEASLRLFRFGVRIYSIHQPLFLSELIRSHLRGLIDEQVLPFFKQAARVAIPEAIEELTQLAESRSDDLMKQEMLRSGIEELTHLNKSLYPEPGS